MSATEMSVSAKDWCHSPRTRDQVLQSSELAGALDLGHICHLTPEKLWA